MSKIYYGCDEVTKGWDRYFGLCNALEVPNVGKVPTVQALNTWRVDSPKGFAFVLHATKEFTEALEELADHGESKLNDAVRKAWTTTLERASALAAKAILIRTSFEFMPSQNTRALMQNFANEFLDNSRVVMWETSGMWDTETTFNWAKDLGFTYVIDPFLVIEDGLDLFSADVALKVVERGGMRRNFDQFDMEDLLAQFERTNRAFVLFRGRHKWRHARELQQVLTRQ